MENKTITLNKSAAHSVPLAAAVARLGALSDGKMGASVARSARIIAALAAVALWKLN